MICSGARVQFYYFYYTYRDMGVSRKYRGNGKENIGVYIGVT